MRYATPVLGGVLINLLVSWILTHIAPAPESATELQSIANFGPVSYFLVFLSIIVLAPVIEEWIFRGFLWYTLSNVFNEKIVLFLVSIIFAACHLDPTLVIGLLPISFFLGWLKMTTGGVKQSIIAHIAHNATGVLITIL